MHKQRLLLAVTCLLGINFWSCTDKNATSTSSTLDIYSYWHSADATDPALDGGNLMQVILSVYNNLYPNTQISYATLNEVATTPGADYDSILTSALESGNPPDVATINQLYLYNTWVAAGYLEPLDDVYAALGGSASFGTIGQSLTRNGHIYGLPLSVINNGLIYYNKHITDAAGVDLSVLNNPNVTWSQVIAASQQVQTYYNGIGDPNNSGWSFFQTASNVLSSDINVKYSWIIKDFFYNCMLPGTLGIPEWQNTVFTGQATTAAWANPNVSTAFNNLYGLVETANKDLQHDCMNNLPACPASDPNCTPCSLVAPYTAVPQGLAGFISEGDWYVAAFRGYTDPNTNQPDPLVANVDWGWFSCPGLSSTFVASVDMFIIPAKAKNLPGAKLFLEVAGDPNVQNNLNVLHGTTPGNLNAPVDADADAYAIDARARLQKDQLVFATENNATQAFGNGMVGPTGAFVATVQGVTDTGTVSTAVQTAVSSEQSLCLSSGTCSN